MGDCRRAASRKGRRQVPYGNDDLGLKLAGLRCFIETDCFEGHRFSAPLPNPTDGSRWKFQFKPTVRMLDPLRNPTDGSRWKFQFQPTVRMLETSPESHRRQSVEVSVPAYSADVGNLSGIPPTVEVSVPAY